MSKLKPPVGANDHVQGVATAPITVVEYGDYECPYCGEAYPITKELQKRLGNKLRFVFRNFPLGEMHPHAEHAAEAAEAAGAQGKFWEMHDMLYEHQDALEDADLARYAKALKLDVPRFIKEMESRTHIDRVRSDFTSGVRSGVNGTPTFFINNTRHDGPFDLASLLAAIA
jgi:protein-disulfide isomerase